MSNHPTATCPTHGDFEADFIEFQAGAGEAQVAGVSQPCPKCGTPSPIPDGWYSRGAFGEITRRDL